MGTDLTVWLGACSTQRNEHGSLFRRILSDGGVWRQRQRRESVVQRLVVPSGDGAQDSVVQYECGLRRESAVDGDGGGREEQRVQCVADDVVPSAVAAEREFFGDSVGDVGWRHGDVARCAALRRAAGCGQGVGQWGSGQLAAGLRAAGQRGSGAAGQRGSGAMGSKQWGCAAVGGGQRGGVLLLLLLLLLLVSVNVEPSAWLPCESFTVRGCDGLVGRR